MGAVFRYNGGPWAEVGSRIGDRTVQVGMQIAQDTKESWGSFVGSIGAGLMGAAAKYAENKKEDARQRDLGKAQMDMAPMDIPAAGSDSGPDIASAGTGSPLGNTTKETYDMSAIGDVNARMQYESSLAKQKAADSLSLTLPFTPVQRNPFV